MIRVHVLGGGKGESIILELPDGKWGVVDCYSRRLGEPAANPTYRFLELRKIRRLEFLCLTHPHDDHFRGMSHLLEEEMEVAQFWRFGTWSREQLSQIIDDISFESEIAGGEARESVNDLYRTMWLISERVERKQTVVTGLSDVKLLYRASWGRGRVLTIHSIAPSTGHSEAYQQAVLRHFLCTATRQHGPEQSRLRHGTTRCLPLCSSATAEPH